MNEQIYAVEKKMTFDFLSKIWNACQKQKAKSGITKKERAKTSLTNKELQNKYAQLGKVLAYKNIGFTFDQDLGMGVLILPTQKIYGATIDDFEKEIQKAGFKGNI